MDLGRRWRQFRTRLAMDSRMRREEDSGTKKRNKSALSRKRSAFIFPNGERARGREGRGTVKRFIQSMSLTAAHLTQVPASQAMTACCLGAQVPQECQTSIFDDTIRTGVVRSGLKKLGDSKAALQHLRSEAETHRSKGGWWAGGTATAILGGWSANGRWLFPLHCILH